MSHQKKDEPGFAEISDEQKEEWARTNGFREETYSLQKIDPERILKQIKDRFLFIVNRIKTGLARLPTICMNLIREFIGNAGEFIILAVIIFVAIFICIQVGMSLINHVNGV